MERRVDVRDYNGCVARASRARRRLERLGWIVVQADGLGWLLAFPWREDA